MENTNNVNVNQSKRIPEVLQELLALKVQAERIVEIQIYGLRLYNIATQKAYTR